MVGDFFRSYFFFWELGSITLEAFENAHGFILSVGYAERSLVIFDGDIGVLGVIYANVGAFADSREHLSYLLFGALDLHRDRAVFVVSHPTGSAVELSRLHSAIAEADSLHAAVKGVAAADGFSFKQRHSITPIDVMDTLYQVIVRVTIGLF